MQDLNDLSLFAQVVQHGSFSAASRATGVPKSRLSRRIAQLERDLGVQLLRGPRAKCALRRLARPTTRAAATCCRPRKPPAK
jgi:DNA-binding transcriptional LysR family regulator